jgi:outer membrane lipoprotein-sorting protein
MRKLMPEFVDRGHSSSSYSVSVFSGWVRIWKVTGYLVAFTSSSSYAQYPGYTSVKNMLLFNSQFAAESSKITSITCDFSQEKTLTALTEKIASRGKFWFKRSNKLRLEYTEPFVYLIIMNGDKMLVRDDKKENRFNVKASKLFKQMNRIMIDCVQGNILESKDFTTRVFENGTTFVLEMTPVSGSLREFFQTVVLTVDKKDYSAKSIAMNEPMGDITVILFEHKKLNEPIADTVFAH